MAVSPDDGVVASASNDRTIRVWSLAVCVCEGGRGREGQHGRWVMGAAWAVGDVQRVWGGAMPQGSGGCGWVGVWGWAGWM